MRFWLNAAKVQFSLLAGQFSAETDASAMSFSDAAGENLPPNSDARSFASTIAQGEAIMQKEVAAKVPGCAITVAVDKTVVWSQGFGYSDLALKRPVTASTRFRIGSVSKPLAAAGLALLLEEDRLDLDLPIHHYLPDYPAHGATITTRMLAGHLSGIRNYKGSEAFRLVPGAKLSQHFPIFADNPLLSVPGEKFSYTSYNYCVLGAIMETVAQQDFLSFLSERVLQPLALENTVADHLQAADSQRAECYEANIAGGFAPSPKIHNCLWPAGGYLSTTDDMVRFGCAHFGSGFLNSESRQLLFTPQNSRDGKPVPYGIGWMLYPGKAVAFHTGGSVGGRSVLILLPGIKTVLAIACNRGLFTMQEINGKYRFAPKSDAAEFDLARVGISIAKLFGRAT